MTNLIKRFLRKLINPVQNGDANHFHNYPFGREPRSSKETYLEIWEKAKKHHYPMIDQFENDFGFAIDSRWFHDLALHTQVVIKESEICYQHGRLLYTFLSDYLKKNNIDSVNILETGTARGFSSLCMAKALQDQVTNGKILTIDPLPHNVKMFWNCIDDNEGQKTRAQLLIDYSELINRFIWFIEGKSKDLLNKHELSRIHFAFLDGSHDYDDLKFEVSYVVSRQQKGDIIFFDDFNHTYFPGIVQAVKELEFEGNYSVKVLSANDQRGYAIAEKL